MLRCHECSAEFEESLLLDEVDGELVEDLSAAVRRGDLVEAEALLDRIFAENAALSERVQRARHSGRAKAA